MSYGPSRGSCAEGSSQESRYDPIETPGTHNERLNFDT